VLAVNASVGEQVAGTGTTGGSTQGGSEASTSQTNSGSSSSGSSSSSNSNDFIVIADLTKLQIGASVDQVDIPKIAKDQNVSIAFDAISGKEFEGKVVSIDPTPVNTQGVITYKIKSSIENPDSKIQLGMTADLQIDVGAKKNVLVVPNLAVRPANGLKVVRKIIDGVPTDVPVKVGLSDDQNTEITSGLSEGDEIVVNVFSSTGQGQQGGGTSTQRTPGMPFMGR
jgi:macrolide-specific efflux system membrane fusion protein